MAILKETVSHFSRKYEDYRRTVYKSISKMETEYNHWLSEGQDLDKSWPNTTEVDDIHSLYPHDKWMEMLAISNEPDILQVMHTLANNIKELSEQQNFMNLRILDFLEKDTQLAERLELCAHAQYSERKLLAQSLKKLKKTQKEQLNHRDDLLDPHIAGWKSLAIDTYSPLKYDFDAPQPWWVRPWILTIFNPEMAKCMKQASTFKKETGLNLYDTVLDYESRKLGSDAAGVEYSVIEASYERASGLYAQTLNEKNSNARLLAFEQSRIFPETGSLSLKARVFDFEYLAIDTCIRHGLRNRWPHIGSLSIPQLSEQEIALRNGKLKAVEKSCNILQRNVFNYKVVVSSLEKILENLATLSRKHGPSAKVGIDISNTTEMVSHVEQSSTKIIRQFGAARPLLSQSSPFRTSPQRNYESASLKSNATDSDNQNNMFWTLAWMHMLWNQNVNSNESQLNDIPLLDPEEFESSVENSLTTMGYDGKLAPTLLDSLIPVIDDTSLSFSSLENSFVGVDAIASDSSYSSSSSSSSSSSNDYSSSSSSDYSSWD